MSLTYNNCKTAVESETWDTMNVTEFARWYSDWYRRVMQKVKEVDPNRFIASEAVFNLTANNWAELDHDIPATCLTVERIEYPNPDNVSDDLQPIKMPDTKYDEESYRRDVRWYRLWDKIYFRSVIEDIDDVKLIFKIKIVVPSWDNAPSFPDPLYDTLLVDYCLARYFKKENLETDWRPYMEEFERQLDYMVDDIQPTNEQVTLDVTVDDWIS